MQRWLELQIVDGVIDALALGNGYIVSVPQIPVQDIASNV